MRIDIVTIFPQLIAPFSEHGVCGRAVQNGIAQLKLWNPRDFSDNKHRRVDDRPFGGGPGMVMQALPLSRTLQTVRDEVGSDTLVSYLSPEGQPLNNGMVKRLAQRSNLILLSGRYEGIDERVLAQNVDEEISIGDYVLSGGELAAMVVMETVIRCLPGVLGNETSAEQDSFVEGLLDCGHYTRPEVYNGVSVPQVLLSGDHVAIKRWRHKQSLGRTWLKRPDLLDRLNMNTEQQKLLNEFKREYCPDE